VGNDRNDTFSKLDAMQRRVGDVLVSAYSKASTCQEDLDDIAALKAAGVILPNGFKPMSPLSMKEGDELLENE